MLTPIKTTLATNLKSKDYVDPEKYVTFTPSETNLRQAIGMIGYTIYVSSGELGTREATLVFDKQQEERLRTQQANRLMAGWVKR